MSAKCNDYRLSNGDADWLKGVVLLPVYIRAQALQKYLDDHGPRAFVNLFAQFVGMANSVIENCRDSLEIFGVITDKLTEREAEQLNLPTLFGALRGVPLANRVPQQDNLCHGCAYRLGTLANQSASTTCDIDDCRANGEQFYCHENMVDENTPTAKCRGAILAGHCPIESEATT